MSKHPKVSMVLPRSSVKTRVTLSVLAIFLASLWSLSYYASTMLRKDMQQLLGDQQFSTASHVASEINRQLEARFEVLNSIAAKLSPAILENATALQTYLEQLALIQELFNGGVLAYRMEGTAMAEVPLTAGRIGTNYMDIDTVAAALKEGKASIGRPVMGKKLRAPVFGMTVPIRDAQGSVMGAVSGVTNLGQPSFLDEITRGHYGKTGGYLLVAPQHRLVVTATDKRRVMDRIPEPGVNPLIDRFAQGYEGSVVLTNPLGAEVLASAKGIPVANWYLSVALPTAEAFAPIDEMQEHMRLATLVLTLLAGFLTWWLIKRQLAPVVTAARALATMSASNQPPQPLPIARPDEIGQLIGGFNRLLARLAEREEERRIAAIAFECQEGMAVMDANSNFLRVNQAFTQITGYSQKELQGKTSSILRSDRHPASFYEGKWSEARRDGLWQGELWFRRKSGEDFPARVTVTAVKDEINQITHYVGNLTDATDSQRQEHQRLANEAHQRDMLIREVHHRIKNNLQGIIGMLRQFAQQHPATAEPIMQAIGQVQGISVIHGLRGRVNPSSVQLCELTSIIAAEVSTLWQTPVHVDLPIPWAPCTLAEQEAVPMALILNELIVNAVKHGGQAHGDTCVSMRKGQNSDWVLTTISNTGTLPTDEARETQSHAGLKLVRSLLPRSGVALRQKQVAHQVVTELEIHPPVISLKKDPSP
jgi:PAS domain S-box-containing protein